MKFTDTVGNGMLALLTAATKVSLHSGDPAKTGANELAGTGYAQQDVTMATTTAQAIANDDLITFGAAGADWLAATHFGLWNDVTFLGGAALSAPKTVLNGDSATFASGALSVSLV